MSLRARLLAVFAAFAITITGIGASFGPATAQDDANVLRLGSNTSDIATLDPHFASGTQDRTIVDMVFNGLVRYEPGGSTEFEPDIATEIPEPEENEDGSQSWTFPLRDDVMCHPTAETDAHELTAADVVFSLEKAADEETSAVAVNYAGWSFEEGDDNSVVITVEEPISETLLLPNVANYAGGYIVCQESYEALGADTFTTAPAGTGPFMFESYTPQDSVVLTAFEDFHRGTPELDGVQVRFIGDNTSREFAFLSGELDVIAGLPEAQWVDRINEEDGVSVDVFGVGEVVWLDFNVEHEVLQDPLVREAIMLAVDPASHIAVQGEPVAEAVHSVVPEVFMPGGLTQEEAEEAGAVFEQDIDRALELMEEAGYADGFELELVASEQAAYLNVYEVLQEELSQIGIDVSLEVVQHAAMHDLIREDANAIIVYVAYRPTADQYLTQFYSTEGGSTNFSNFTMDELVLEARATVDPDEQEELWKQASSEIIEENASFALMYTNQVYAKTDAVDYGHELEAVPQLYPGINENTTLDQGE